MNMKQFLLASLLIIFFNQVDAQKLFASFGAGYGIAVSSSILGYNEEDNSVANTFFTENVKGSYGKGMSLNIAVGYMINDKIGLELGGNYLMGSKYTFTNVDINSTTSSTKVDEIHATSFRLIPGIRLSFGENKLKYYSRIGLAIGVMNKLTDNYNRTSTNPGGTELTSSTFEYSGGTYLGFSGAFGLTYDFSEHMALYAEINRYFISWAPTTGEYTNFTVNGEDQLGSMETKDKKFEYLDRIDQSMNQNSFESRKELKVYSPLNSLGLSVGLHFTFGG